MKIGKNSLVVIITSNYNGASYFYKKHNILWHIFSSLKRTKYKNYKIVMADDKSTDNSVEYIKKKFPYVSIVINNANGGFSKNNNNAIKYAIQKYKPDYIMLLNNDIIITDDLWLNKLINTARLNSKIGIVGCKLVYPDGKIQHAGMEIGCYGGRNIGRGQEDFSKFNYVKEVDGVTFAAVLINKNVIKKIGLFDENFFMGFEDVDYYLRAKKAKFKIYYAGNVKLIHLEGFTSTNSKFQKIKYNSFYHNQVNYWYFMLKYRYMKQFRGINRLKSIFIFFISSIISIEGRDRERKLSSIRFKDKPLTRLLLTIKAISKAKKLYTKLNKI
jgi:GT2 family glycosyltransferase